jgi:predicted nucleotidyltransferase
MDVFGFSESLSGAEQVLMPGNVRISIVRLPALALLKIIAWDDRHRRFPGKDAADLTLILRNYLAVPSNQERLWRDFSDWAESLDFDYEISGARMLGHDIRRLVDEKGLTKVERILRAQFDAGELPQEMQWQTPQHALALLKSLHAGLVA